MRPPDMRSMRRKEKEVTSREEMVRVILEAEHVTVAMCDEAGPYLVTLTHGYDEGRNALYFHCAREGRKVDALRRDDRVWGQAMVDLGYADGSCDHLYQTTQFKGRATFVDDIEEKRHALRTMIRQHESDPERLFEEQVTEETLRSVCIGRIDVDLMTGKRSDKVEVAT